MSIEQQTEGWLTEAYDYDPPQRGQNRQGVVLKVEDHGATIDIGLKRDGFVPQEDLDRLDEDELSELKPNQEVTAQIVQPNDRNGNLILSLFETKVEEDWTRAEELLSSGETSAGIVTDSNRGGLLVSFGHLEGFLPASHLSDQSSKRLSGSQRQEKLQAYIGRELPLKVIEVDRNRRRLILSERLAKRQLRDENTERLLEELVEGEVRQGTVSQLANFGAFVDLGGADGLIHISELSWQRVKHPRDVLQVGDEIDVYILNLDYERKRISLSLKRLQPNPWTYVDEAYQVGQLVSGRVTNVVDFGAFIALDIGIQGLLHVSEIGDPPPEKPGEVVQTGEELILRILRIEPSRQRLALSLKTVSAHERDNWLAQQAAAQNEPETEADPDLSANDDEETINTAETAPAFTPAAEAESQWVEA